MKSTPLIRLLLACCFSASQALAGILPEADYFMPDRTGAEPSLIFNGKNPDLTVPEILQLQTCSHCLDVSDPKPFYQCNNDSLSWEELMDLQTHQLHQLPEGLVKAIQQWLLHQQDIDFSQPVLPIPNAGPVKQVVVNDDGIHVERPDTENVRVKLPPFRIVISTDTDRLAVDFNESDDSPLLATNTNMEWLSEPLMAYLLGLTRIAVMDIWGNEVFALTKNGRLIHVTLADLRKLLQQFREKLRLLAYEQLMAFIEYWFEYPVRRVVPAITYGTDGPGQSGRIAGKRTPRTRQDDSVRNERSTRPRRDVSERDGDREDPDYVPEAEPRRQQQPRKRSGLTAEEKGREKAKILKKAQDAGLPVEEVTDFHDIIFARVNQVVSNALVYFGVNIKTLSQNGKLPAPDSGQQLAVQLRNKYHLESQYLARMMRHFRYTPASYYPAEPGLLRRYQKALVYLLQYIALEDGGWLLSEQVIQEWLVHENSIWEQIIGIHDYPDLSEIEWSGIRPRRRTDFASIYRTTHLPPLGPAVKAEFDRFQEHVELSKNDRSSYKPEVGDRSFFYLMTLVSSDSSLRQAILSWIKAMDPRYPMFFQYISTNWSELKRSGPEDSGDSGGPDSDSVD